MSTWVEVDRTIVQISESSGVTDAKKSAGNIRALNIVDRQDCKIPGVLKEVFGGLAHNENQEIWDWFLRNSGFLSSVFTYEDIKKRLLRLRRQSVLEVNNITCSLIGEMHDTFQETIKKTLAIFRDDLLFVSKDIGRLNRMGFFSQKPDT